MGKVAGIASLSTILCLPSVRLGARVLSAKYSMQLPDLSVWLRGGPAVTGSRQDAERLPSTF